MTLLWRRVSWWCWAAYADAKGLLVIVSGNYLLSQGELIDRESVETQLSAVAI
jgi:hypothetical protein